MLNDIQSDAEADVETPSSSRLRQRLAIVLTFVLVILLLAFVPPLINVSRLQRRIARNISASIGRPVHFDRVSLTLLPMPGFTLENFVIDEDPAFGYEPILRADEVNAVLRLSSLWRGHPEFSRISLTEPTSVNLVHLSDGRWNIESLLFQASHIPAAPTTQRHAGSAPRFPYIEAAGARVNLKLDQSKTPFSLSQAEFALWEPEPNQWRLRLTATPVRTDVAPGETGTIRMEGTLGTPNRAVGSLTATPIDFSGDWKEAQLGGLTQFVAGSDAGVRGDVSATFAVHGTLQQSTISARIAVLNARRADFIPPAPLTLEAGCEAHASQTFHAFSGIACYWPPADSDNRSTLIVAADIPDVRTPETASVRVTLPAVPAATFFNWLSIATPHPPLGLAGPGTLSGELLWGVPAPVDGAPLGAAAATSSVPGWSGELELSGGSIAVEHGSPIPLGDVVLEATRPQPPVGSRRHHAPPPPPPVPPVHDSFDLLPVELDLGGKDSATLTGHLDDTGYTLSLAGSVLPSRLLEAGEAVPQLGDGLGECLPAPPAAAPAKSTVTNPRGRSAPATETDTTPEDPIVVNLSAHRSWGGPQSWCPAKEPAARQTGLQLSN